MRYYAILNPVAGKGKLAQIESKLKLTFDRLGIEGEMVKTISPGDAGHLARLGLKKGYSHFLCVGGDGTVFEIINGILDAPITIGIVPIGANNLFAQSLGCDQYPWQNLLEQYASVPRSIAVDVGKVNNYLFLSSAGLGLCVNNIIDLRDKHSQRIKKNSWLKNITTFYKPQTIYNTTIMIEKKYTVNVAAYDVEIVNAGYFFQLPQKILFSTQDRLLDLVTIDNSLSPREARKLKQSRILTQSEGVSHIPGKHFVIQKPDHLTLQVDGELLDADTPLIFTQAPFQIRFLLPQKY
ncbi:MAG: hypothetical protein HY817_05920 [Candidatus Abawacabacteria bacterium]|nr:hypothetical protein [Candidatus Abawacabacteria bacterium]